jgi:hypothetical protein
MHRKLVLLVALALVSGGCGGGGGGAKTHTVLEVSKAFSDAGLPFSGLVTGNPYVAGQVPFLPGALNESNLRFDVEAELSGSSTADHTGEVVWVFDTVAHAKRALGKVPLAKWGQGPRLITRTVLGNVIVVASGFTGAPKGKLDEALSTLRSG